MTGDLPFLVMARRSAGHPGGPKRRVTLWSAGILLVFAVIGHSIAQTAPMELSILSDGNVRFGNGPELDQKAFLNKVRELKAQNPRPEIRISPDRKAPYSVVARVLQTFQQEDYGVHLGFTGISQ